MGYTFIEDLNRNILSKSKLIQGRFYVCPMWGHELNSDNLDQLIDTVLTGEEKRKYPLVIMLPPSSFGDYSKSGGNWDDYNFVLLFLNTSFVDSAGMIANRNPATNTSRHTILHDWHDMKRCAIDYLKVMKGLMKSGRLTHFRLSEKNGQVIDPVSTIANDRVSGVMVQYSGSIFDNCTEIQDYPADVLNTIDIPAADSHPYHT